MTLYKWSQTAASDATADPTINWAEGQAPSSVNDSARAMTAATAKYRDDIAGAIVTSGTSTAYAVSSYEVFAGPSQRPGDRFHAAHHQRRDGDAERGFARREAVAHVSECGPAIRRSHSGDAICCGL